jgi:hypothetical protein
MNPSDFDRTFRDLMAEIVKKRAYRPGLLRRIFLWANWRHI